MTRAAIGFGSNLGDRRSHLDLGREAVSRLGVDIVASSIYETAPIGPVEQGAFLNAVLLIETERVPTQLLSALHEIEQRLGRLRDVHWGPRTLDLDILLYGSEAVDLPGLTIPHAELTNRRFALQPLLEVWPDATLPDGTPLEELLSTVADQDVAVVGPWDRPGWWEQFRKRLARRWAVVARR